MTDKHHLSVIIPTVGEKDSAAAIVQAYLDSGVKDRIYVQFVYLVNRKNPPPGPPKNEINTFDGYEEIIARSSYYLASAEENLFRIRDFLPALKPWVVVTGDHDELYWDNMLKALDVAASKKLDVLAVNVLNKELQTDGSYDSSPGIIRVNKQNTAQSIVEKFWNGEVLGASIIYPALLSSYGPVDWLAYFGSDIYSRDVFRGLLQFRFSDWVYSLPYMKVSYFRVRNVNYGFFSEPVFARVSDEFIRLKGPKGLGWIEDHRTAAGSSKIFWITNLNHLSQVDDDKIFAVIACGFLLSHLPLASGKMEITRRPTLLGLFYWASELISQQMHARSHYFPDQFKPSYLHDIRHIVTFNRRFLSVLEKNPAWIEIVGNDFVRLLITATALIENYLFSDHAVYISEEAYGKLLPMAYNSLTQCMMGLSAERYERLSEAAFMQLYAATQPV